MPEISETLGPLLCGLFCIGITFLAIIGVVGLLIVNRNHSREKVSIHPDWPAIPGRVTIARVEESARTRVDDDAFYYPYIEFEYVVEGQVYTGKQGVGRPSNLEFKAKQTLANHPVGSDVVVYYNPVEPGQARLAIQ